MPKIFTVLMNLIKNDSFFPKGDAADKAHPTILVFEFKFLIKNSILLFK